MANDPELTFEKEPYADILADDARYDSRAYDFILDVIREATRDTQSHISGGELLDVFRDMALDAWGPLAYTVLDDWGIRSCEDVGEIVFNLVEHKRIGKTETDTKADFIGRFNFVDEFLAPYEP